jgi:hypothetical protein
MAVVLVVLAVVATGNITMKWVAPVEIPSNKTKEAEIHYWGREEWQLRLATSPCSNFKRKRRVK